MPHTPLIATIVAGIGLAFVLGTLANRLRLPPLVGYLAAGVLIGPFTPGFVADQALARQLAELGVILLLFGIGLQFSLDDLLPVKAIALVPLRDAFAVLFFVSVGMLFDPVIPLREPLLVGAALLVIVLGNAAAVSAVALTFRHSLQVAFTLGVSLSQIGEFSFILAGLGVELRLLPEAGRDLILAGAILSILVNPLLFVVLDRLTPWLGARERGEAAQQKDMPERAEQPVTNLTGHAVLVGHGRVGSLVAETLKQAGVPYLVIEERQETVDQLRARKIEVIAGNAAQPGLLEAANLTAARWLISAIPNPFESGNLIEQAHAASPAPEIIARAHSDAEVAYLKKCGASLVIMGEREIARGISEHILSKIGTATASKAEEGERPAKGGTEPADGHRTGVDR